MNALETEVKYHKQELDELERTMRELTSQLESTGTQLTRMQEQAETLKEENATLRDRIAASKQNNTGIRVARIFHNALQRRTVL